MVPVSIYSQLPFYIRFTVKLFMLFLLGVMLIYAKSLFVPLAFSILLSILLLPVTNFLEKKARLPKAPANLVTVLFALTIIAAIIYFLSHQAGTFLRDIPSIKKHLEQHYETLQAWIQHTFHLTDTEQTNIFASAESDVRSSGSVWLGQTFFTITNTLFYTVIVAIYTFLILHYRHTIKRFLYAIFKQPLEGDVTEVLQQSKSIVQKYMLGLMMEMVIVAAANSLVLLALGIKYAIFLGVLTAILNIIPYIGVITGIIFSCFITLTTSSHLSDIIWIIISMEVIHFFDSNFLMTKIVGSRVKINALVTILGVVIGGTLLGLPGIFLALPTIAILKIIFDRVDDLKPWGMLMGDESNGTGRSHLQLKKKAIVQQVNTEKPAD
jgi:predicted PurR-regulated permease PerM